MRRSLLSTTLALCLFAPVGPRLARAQDPEEAQRRATARTLFAEGVAFMREESWAEAADRFRRTLELHPTPVVAFNLGSSLVELDRLVEAAEHLRMTGRFPGAEPEVRREAAALLDEIEPRIGRLRIVVADAPGDAHVEHNGQILTRAQVDIDMPADPGAHLIRLMQGGEAIDERFLELADGGQETITLSGSSPDLSAGAAARSLASGGSEAASVGTSAGEGGDVLEQWWFWALIGVLVVGAAVGIGVGVAVANDGQGGEIVEGDLMPRVLRGVVMVMP